MIRFFWHVRKILKGLCKGKSTFVVIIMLKDVEEVVIPSYKKWFTSKTYWDYDRNLWVPEGLRIRNLFLLFFTVKTMSRRRSQQLSRCMPFWFACLFWSFLFASFFKNSKAGTCLVATESWSNAGMLELLILRAIYLFIYLIILVRLFWSK